MIDVGHAERTLPPIGLEVSSWLYPVVDGVVVSCPVHDGKQALDTARFGSAQSRCGQRHGA